MKGKFSYKKLISLFIIFALTMTSCDQFNKSALEDNSKQTYVVIEQDGDNKKVNTYSLTYAEAEEMRQLDNILTIELDGYVIGSKNSDNNGNVKKKDFYKKEKQNKNTKMLSSKNSNTEWNMQAIRLNSAVLGDDNFILPDMDSNTVSGPAISSPSDNENTNNKNKNKNKNNPIPGIVKVAIIDSGIDYSDDINVYMRKNFIPGEDEVSVIYEDLCGHGTGIAGIIAAKNNGKGISGINSNLQLYSARVLDENNTAPISRVVEAIYWAIGNNVNIINISFGTLYDSEALRLAIQDASNAGILIVAAAGNNNVMEYPSAYDEVIAVGSLNSSGDRSPWSATGEELELMAPGEQILTTGAFGGVMVSSGTSMAAAHVTGVASLLWQIDLSCSDDFIRKLMDFSANKYGDSNEYGYGLIDLENAMKNYHKFKKIYERNGGLDDNIELAKKNGILTENTNEVLTFNDVDYVTGSWTGDGHDEIFDDSFKNVSINNIGKVKDAARLIDTWLGGMHANPQYHGYYAKKENKSPVYESNYIASYIYLSEIAVSVGNGNPVPTPPSYMNADDRNHFANTLNSLLNRASTYEEKKFYMYGFALHTGTDAFAHSSFLLTDGKYIGIVHPGDPIDPDHPDNADRFDKVPNRKKYALDLASKLATHISNNESGSVNDFIEVADKTYDVADGVFYMANYYKYINIIKGQNSYPENSGISFTYSYDYPDPTPTPIPTPSPTPTPIPHNHTGSSISGGGCYSIPSYHTHIGDSTNGGGCYTSPIYHSHSGNSSNGGGCYSILNYHSHSGSSSSGGGCYGSPVYHSHSGSSSSGGGCYGAAVYHSHSGSSSSGTGCYGSPVYHSHSGSSSSGTGCYGSPVYHSHSGSSSSGGGCYGTPVYHSHSGSSSSGGGCYGAPVYHSHTGSSSSGGGCYGYPHYHSHTSSCLGTCGGSKIYVATNKWLCKNCGAISSGSNSCTANVQKCSKTGSTIDYYSRNCGKTTSTIVSYNRNCGKTTSTILYYVLSCGKTTSTVQYYNRNCGKTTSTILYYVLNCGKTTSTVQYYNLNCGKTTNTVQFYNLNCNKTISTVEYYSLGCNKTTSTIIGYNLLCPKTTTTIEYYKLGCGF